MHSISSTLEEGKSRNDIEASERLIAAYRSLFLSGDVNAGVVLVDLLEATGFFETLPVEASDAAVRSHNAMRRIGQRIFNLLHMSEEERAELIRAVKREQFARQV